VRENGRKPKSLKVMDYYVNIHGYYRLVLFCGSIFRDCRRRRRRRRRFYLVLSDD
jgi:hypothetical protein